MYDFSKYELKHLFMMRDALVITICHAPDKATYELFQGVMTAVKAELKKREDTP